jgi:uncharacterized protein
MTTPTATAPHVRPGTARGPVRAGERALAPDLARGAMLLLIALANAAGYFLASAPGVAPNPQGAERVYNFLMIELVHARAFPLFALLFGYGLVQLSRRQEQSGASPRQVRNVLLRRGLALFAFGAVHGVLLYSGDFLGAYGIICILFTLLLLQRSERVHRFAPWYLAVGGVYLLVLAIMAGLGLAGGGSGAAIPVSPFPSAEAGTYLESLAERAAEWPVHTLTIVPMILMVWVGAWAARHRVLEAPHEHLTLLRATAIGGFAVALTAGLPMALLSAGAISVDEGTAGSVRMLYETSGFFGGLGYGALFGLIAYAFSRRNAHGPVLTAIAALGQRSLTGYLFQSVAWLVLAAPFALALPERSGSPLLVSGLCAVLVWAFTVVAADVMRRLRYRGPAEMQLRRMVYFRKAGER